MGVGWIFQQERARGEIFSPRRREEREGVGRVFAVGCGVGVGFLSGVVVRALGRAVCQART
jgi:hypothetical protein